MVASLRRFVTPKRIIITLIILNEIRGLIVVSPIFYLWWKARH